MTTQVQRNKIRDALLKDKEKSTASRQAARASLVRDGIYLANGKLSSKFQVPKKGCA
jgi:hypothetical protein